VGRPRKCKSQCNDFNVAHQSIPSAADATARGPTCRDFAPQLGWPQMSSASPRPMPRSNVRA
jgi:hypothetical protein